ncbi:Transcription regulator of the Arc/MetJ class [Spirosomataceae bacterium TFI 002]|nr:Transcription regulator of the Arc/MetJ class [Spirosomataceae bacterium TFI 002]
MLTNIDIDHDKVAEIMALKKIKTKKEAVNTAVDEYLKQLSALELLKLKGSNLWDGDLEEIRKD